MRPTRPRLLIASLAGTAALAALFPLVLLREDATLADALVERELLPEVSRKALLAPTGTLLTGDLQSRTLAPADQPYLLSGTVRVPRDARVRMEPGVAVYAAEGAQLVVEGSLEADGVIFASNQLHPRARLWHGIAVQGGGSVTLTNVTVSDASAALTCAAGGQARVRGGVLSNNVVGIATLPGSRTCETDGMWVTTGRIGFQLVGGSPVISAVKLDRLWDGMRVFHEARPVIRGLTVRRPGRAALVYRAPPDLAVEGLVLPPGASAEMLVLDGSVEPTHTWRGEQFKTGRLLAR